MLCLRHGGADCQCCFVCVGVKRLPFVALKSTPAPGGPPRGPDQPSWPRPLPLPLPPCLLLPTRWRSKCYICIIIGLIGELMPELRSFIVILGVRAAFVTRMCVCVSVCVCVCVCVHVCRGWGGGERLRSKQIASSCFFLLFNSLLLNLIMVRVNKPSHTHSPTI